MKRDTNKIILILGTLFAVLIPSSFLFNKAYRGPCIDAANAGLFGDFIGGYLGTIFSFISVVLIFCSFKQQRESDEKNARSQNIEKFENKYFEMIRLHRDNVQEIGIGEDFGKKIFVSMLREFREIVAIINNFISWNNIKLETKEKYNIAYCVFFYGTGPNSSRVLKCALKQYDEAFVDSLIKFVGNKETKNRVEKSRKLKYTPFEGHQSRLGHYYRHLYQTITYVENQLELDPEEKYRYVKILRAQLTNHEQAMLFLNSLSDLGREWRVNSENRDLITEYRLIKNLPEEFFDKEREIDVKQFYPNLEFEYEERIIKT